MTTEVHSALKGNTNTIAGSMSATGKSTILAIRKPVAISKIPPHALKSAIMSCVVSGRITRARRNRTIKMSACGMAIIVTTIPRLQAMTIAVNRSKMDLEKRIEQLLVIPASRHP